MKREVFMRKKILWLTETGVMLALLVALQTVTKPLGQLVTGSFVNGVLAVTVLTAGLSSGITVAVISPVLAWLLNIAPQVITVPAIMVGNTVFVVLLHILAGRAPKSVLRQVIAWVVSAAAKFAVLYAIVVWLICGVIQPAGVPKALPAMFSWPQLFTALIGGAVALVIAPVLRKALKK
jgi:hypothetical protein